MKVLVTGSSGLVASALIESLVAKGHQVIRLLRRPVPGSSPSWDPEKGTIDFAGVREIDAVVHLAGDNISEGRWNDQKKVRILNSRVRGTKRLAEYFAALDFKPRIIVSASAVGYYGDRGTECLDETSEPGNDFLADVCKQWEAATVAASEAGIRVVNLRLGMVLSRKGGALKKMLLPFRMGLGGMIGSGIQYMSWVSIDDVVEIIQFVMANESMRGPVNGVSPNPVTNREFTKTLGRIVHRPAIFSVPAFAVRMVFGEMADGLLLASSRVLPRKLMDSGYTFRDPVLGAALESVLKKTSVMGL